MSLMAANKLNGTSSNGLYVPANKMQTFRPIWRQLKEASNFSLWLLYGVLFGSLASCRSTCLFSDLQHHSTALLAPVTVVDSNDKLNFSWRVLELCELDERERERKREREREIQPI